MNPRITFTRSLIVPVLVSTKDKVVYKIRIKDLPKFERPRERLIRFGSQALNNSELLSILLRTGTKQDNVLELANKLLIKYDLTSFSIF